MAENNTAEIALGKGNVLGYVFVAPMGTALPTDATTKLDTKYTNLGYVSEDGITNATDTDTTEVNDMNGTKVLSVVSSYGETYQFALLQTNEDTLKLRYGNSRVTKQNGKITVFHGIPTGDHMRLVFDLVMNDQPKRIVVPDATLSEVDDLQYHSGDAVMYTMTFNANPSAEIQGNTSVDYIGTAAEE
ncbi:hypothetical protein [Aeriscardovia aeriphila]|uniref:Phage major tail protein n=1 Tax=Aeriscardovia aeriphila TaxID=218139 RepID=A0A261FA89_9BIFI|nr:hypothetical protein [Aeriscardovia aeriphila]NYI25781.1 hypothetical protein [Aeriscardovia aeriphila]OZG56069.1 Phage major tail protein [Aeriscardovia aeriphila]